MLTSKAAKSYVNDFIKAYGRLEEFSIDSKRRRIDLKRELTGEADVIGVTIEKYQVEKKDGQNVPHRARQLGNARPGCRRRCGSICMVLPSSSCRRGCRRRFEAATRAVPR